MHSNNRHQQTKVDHPLWQQAEAAEQAGRYEEAERLYFELARQMNAQGRTYDIANLCYTRIHALREKHRPKLPAPPHATGSTAAIGSQPADIATPGSSHHGAMPIDNRAQGASLLASSNNAAVNPSRWHGPGRLVRSAIALDGRKTYALESQPGVVMAYVVAPPGVDLDRYLNTTIRAYGAVQTRRGLSYPLLTAITVEPAVPSP
jgi:hypothetical protein